MSVANADKSRLMTMARLIKKLMETHARCRTDERKVMARLRTRLS